MRQRAYRIHYAFAKAMGAGAANLSPQTDRTDFYEAQAKCFALGQCRPGEKGGGKTSVIEGLNDKRRNRVLGLAQKPRACKVCLTEPKIVGCDRST